MPRVSRVGRLLDLLGALFLLLGAGLVTWAWIGFRGVPDFEPTVADGIWAATRRADGYSAIQWTGVAAIAAGIGVFVYAWWRERTRRAEVDGPGTPEEGDSRP